MESLFNCINNVIDLNVLKSEFERQFKLKSIDIQNDNTISSYVKLVSDYLPQSVINTLKNDLDLIEYTEPQVRNQPFTSFYGPHNYTYGSARKTVTLQTLGNVDKIASISAIKQRLEKEFDTKINSCQVNWYKDSKSLIHFHKDNDQVSMKTQIYSYSHWENPETCVSKVIMQVIVTMSRFCHWNTIQ